MDILGVGPLELLFILIIALIVLGPGDMVKAGRTIGRFLRMVVKSDTWRMVQNTSRDLRHLPNTLIRQAGLEEEAQMIQESMKFDDIQDEIQGEFDKLKEVQKQTEADISDWTTPPSIAPPTLKEASGSSPVEDQSIVDISEETVEDIEFEAPETNEPPGEASVAGSPPAEDASLQEQGEA